MSLTDAELDQAAADLLQAEATGQQFRRQQRRPAAGIEHRIAGGEGGEDVGQGFGRAGIGPGQRFGRAGGIGCVPVGGAGHRRILKLRAR